MILLLDNTGTGVVKEKVRTEKVNGGIAKGMKEWLYAKHSSRGENYSRVRNGVQ